MPVGKGLAKKAGGKGKKDKGSEVDPAEVVSAFQKSYAKLAKERGLEPLKLGPPEEGGALLHDEVFARVVLHPSMPGPTCDVTSFVTLIDALAFYKYVRNMCIWRIPLGEEGCARLARYLKASKAVSRVEVVDCAVSPEGCASLAGALRGNVALMRLSLDHNPVGDAGIQSLASALEANEALQSMSLRFCAITPDGAGACARVVSHSKLKDFDVQGNELQALGAAHVIAALEHNKTLVRLGLACTTWGPEPVVTQAMLTAMELNSTCNEFNIDGNPVGDANAQKLLTQIKAFTHVTGLITTDQLSHEVFHEIVKVTGANAKEWAKKNRRKKGKGRKGGKKK